MPPGFIELKQYIKSIVYWFKNPKNKKDRLIMKLPKVINMIAFLGLHYLLTFLYAFLINYTIFKRAMCMEI